MTHIKTLQELFQRYRKPGDLVFAVVFLLIALFLLANLGEQTKWVKRTKLFAQPAFWPAISLAGMVFFAALHWISSALSPRIAGRWREVWFWVRSVEYAFWFMAYVLLVPQLGYLPSTIVFTILLALRSGSRGWRAIGSSALAAIVIVLVFKTFLQVKVPGGQAYELLPGALRAFMLTYF
jgi:hypothetical protein